MFYNFLLIFDAYSGLFGSRSVIGFIDLRILRPDKVVRRDRRRFHKDGVFSNPDTLSSGAVRTVSNDFPRQIVKWTVRKAFGNPRGSLGLFIRVLVS